jgi:hypothetical protein
LQAQAVKGNLAESSIGTTLPSLQSCEPAYFTCVVIGWSFGNTKVAINLVGTFPLFIPSCTIPGSTENVSPVL